MRRGSRQPGQRRQRNWTAAAADQGARPGDPLGPWIDAGVEWPTPSARPEPGTQRRVWRFEEAHPVESRRRLGQEGRQKMPVELTAYTNLPSACGSRSLTARHRASNSGSRRLVAELIPVMSAVVIR